MLEINLLWLIVLFIIVEKSKTKNYTKGEQHHADESIIIPESASSEENFSSSTYRKDHICDDLLCWILILTLFSTFIDRLDRICAYYFFTPSLN